MAVAVALLTDFGLDDWYVGVMKAVILSINPHAGIVDLTHCVPARDVEAGGFAVMASCGYLPEGSVVAVVVDPGVGGERRILCALSGGRLFVFPDNGVLTELFDRQGFGKMVSVENADFMLAEVSRTFHGRDIFAPVAAHLSLGVDMEKLGPRTGHFTRIEIPSPRIYEGHGIFRVRWIDRFGNLITDCRAEMLEEMRKRWRGVSIDFGPKGRAPLVGAYEEAAPGGLVGLLGSSGYLEVSVSDGDAARALGVSIGDEITLRKVSGARRR